MPQEGPPPVSGQVGKAMSLGFLGALGARAAVSISCVMFGNCAMTWGCSATFQIKIMFTVCTVKGILDLGPAK